MRPYRKADLDWIVQTADKAWRPINASYRKSYGDELFTLLFPTPDTRKGAEMRQTCMEHPEMVYVCEEEGKRVAFLTILFDRAKRMGIIGNNAVDPDCGLKGIGQQMYRFALERFRAEGMRWANVDTGLDEGHAPARRAYERAGFDISISSIRYYRKL